MLPKVGEDWGQTAVFWDRLFVCSPRGTVWRRLPGEWRMRLVGVQPVDHIEGQYPEVSYQFAIEK